MAADPSSLATTPPASRHAAMRPPVICLVTDRSRLPDWHRTLVDLVAKASAAGVGLVHVRERDLDDRQLLALTRRIVAAAAPGTAVVVNDRADIAIAAGAAGVHLRGDSMPADRLRSVLPGGMLIGRSVHSDAEAIAAANSGVDYLVMGTIYQTRGKSSGTVAGVSALEAVCRAVAVPVLAIGGVTVDNAPEVAAAGAAGIAAIGLFSSAMSADRPAGLDRALQERVEGLRNAFGG